MQKHLNELCVEQVNSNPLIFQQQDALAGLFGWEQPGEPGESVPFPDRPPLPETPENERGQWLWDGSVWQWFGRTDRRRLHGGGVLPTGRWRSAREEKLNGLGSGEFVPWWKLDLQLEGIERRRGRASQWDEGKAARRTMEDVRAQTLRAGDLKRWDLPAWLHDFGFKLTPTERSVVGAVVYCHWRQSGGLYDCQVAVAERFGVDERTIRNALWGRPAKPSFGLKRRPGLVERGFVRVTQTWGPGTEGRPSDKSWLILRVGPELEPMVEMAVYEKPRGARPPRGSGITRVIAGKYMGLVRRYVKLGVYERTREAWEERRGYEAKAKAKSAAGDRSVDGGASGAVSVVVRGPEPESESPAVPVAAVPRPSPAVGSVPPDSRRDRVSALGRSSGAGAGGGGGGSAAGVSAGAQAKPGPGRQGGISTSPNSTAQTGASPSPKPEKFSENTAPVGGGGSFRTPPPTNGRLGARARRVKSSCGKLHPAPQKLKERPLSRPLPSRHDLPHLPSTSLSAWVDLQTSKKGTYGPPWDGDVGGGLQPSASRRDRETEPPGERDRLGFFDPYAADRRVLASQGPASSVRTTRRRPDTSETEAAITKLRTRRDMGSRSLERTVTGVLERNPELGSVLGEFLNSALILAEKPKARAQPADAVGDGPEDVDCNV